MKTSSPCSTCIVCRLIQLVNFVYFNCNSFSHLDIHIIISNVFLSHLKLCLKGFTHTRYMNDYDILVLKQAARSSCIL